MLPTRKTPVILKTDLRAVTTLEYGMVASLIAVAAVTVMSGLGNALSSVLSSVNSGL
jgi:Flp pilus assembly pilin Flp